MRREKVPFEPLVPGKVGMYVCGPTPYAPAHIGHAYSAISFDTIRRGLRFLGFQVRYVRNITDVEPKVSTHIAEIIALTAKLVDNGSAYAVDGDVYFACDTFPAYGQLSGQSL